VGGEQRGRLGRGAGYAQDANDTVKQFRLADGFGEVGGHAQLPATRGVRKPVRDLREHGARITMTPSGEIPQLHRMEAVTYEAHRDVVGDWKKNRQETMSALRRIRTSRREFHLISRQ